ncbi:expressed protein [Phakopsora pachyrhizi]|uniref:Expressed protein n=1 Tax=Phakopsora pachyrhizi TaxID=170000 RepID=A0AAV0BDR9_PHAPC|nr:expressed protein [Phakopsora pachyrhizi]
MSAPETSPTHEPTAEATLAANATPAPVTESETQNSETVPQTETPTTQPASAVETVSAPAVEATPETEPKATEPPKAEEEKKDKKTPRKPFADLLNKIRKPLEKPSPVEKKSETDAQPTEEPAPQVSIPATDAAAADVAIATEGDAAAEATAAEDAPKDATTPRKERANHFFEKITAFVMKPKSPKAKKAEVVKDEIEEAKPTEAPVAEAGQAPTENAVVISADTPAAETAEQAPAPAQVEGLSTNEAAEESKVEKKEKTPKDFAKIARRFSGRLFGVEKKDKSAKKAEPTKEEVEETAAVSAEPSGETPAAAVSSEAAPQIPAGTATTEQTADVTQPASEAAPVIAAAA